MASQFLPRGIVLLTLVVVCIAANGIAGAKQRSSAQGAIDCLHDEPDSIQISWNSPCQDGSWLMDTEPGCRMWDWHPAPEDTATWTGTCRVGKKVGPGMVQWFEHGRPIDRFSGSFVAGRRQGRGLYVWNETDWYDGYYEDDVPHGPGTAHIAGEVFVGQWNRGCLKQGIKVVAIGVLRKSCEKHEDRMGRHRGDFEEGITVSTARRAPAACSDASAERRAVAPDNPLLACEKVASTWISTCWDGYRQVRDTATEAMFLGRYGSPLLQAIVGLGAEHAGNQQRVARDLLREADEARMRAERQTSPT